MRIIDILFAVAGGAVLFGGYAVLQAPADEASAEVAVEQTRLPLVEVARVEYADAVAGVVQTALLRPVAEVVVTAEATGRVAWVNPDFALGRSLPAGAPIFQMDTARLETDVDRAVADVAVAEAELQRTREEAGRISALVERNVSAQSNLTTSEANASAAEARLAQARAALRAAEIALEDATVTAPFDAIVASEALSLGQFLQAGAEVGRLVASESAELLVRLNAEQLRLLQSTGNVVGREVTVRATDGSGAAKSGWIQQISLTTETATQTTGVLVAVNQPFEGPTVFRLNALMEVEIPTPNGEPVLSVPVAAVQSGNRIWAVRDGLLRPVNATIERRSADRVLILTDDVAPGEDVLLTRLPDAIDGLRVRTTTADDSRLSALLVQ